MQDKKISVSLAEEKRNAPATAKTAKGREQLLREEMRVKREMQSTGIRKKMSISNFDHLSRDVYDGAKANSPRA